MLFPPPFPFPFAPSPPLSSLSLPLLQTQEEGGKEHLGAGSSSKCEGAGLEQSHWECAQPLQKYVPLYTASQHFSTCHMSHVLSALFSAETYEESLAKCEVQLKDKDVDCRWCAGHGWRAGLGLILGGSCVAGGSWVNIGWFMGGG